MPTEKSQAEVFQDDIHALLEALDLGNYARPESAHQVLHQEVIPAIKRLKRQADSSSPPSPVAGGCAQALTAAAEVAQELRDEHGLDPAKVFKEIDTLLADLDRISYALLQDDCDLSHGDDEEYLRSIQQKIRDLEAEGEA